ncbi:MAG: DNA polymerase/3'-5' exonuclease PolX [Kiritimatiellaeota bacterium]|nr:DNA polymerase/3'-5' exonuclease PolX [Kiritimatiellota bacterium]
MDKKEIAALFEAIGTLLELKGENPFRVRAYTNAARALESQTADLRQLADEGRLTEIKGIGPDLAAKITEALTTGHLKLHDELLASLPAGLLDLLRIPGFGPKKAKIVYEQLHVNTIKKLEAACQSGAVAKLPGFGEKSQQNILAGIALIRKFSGRHLVDTAAAAAQPVLAALRACAGVIRADIAGSLRRRRETIGDVDFIVSARPADAPGILAAFTTLPGLLSVSAQGPTKASVVLAGGIQADLRVVSDEQYAFALNYFTGSKEHNIALRARALKLKQLSLNEYGFSPAAEQEKSAKELGSRLACPTEEALYAALELAYIPPELREDMGELDAAARGPLPRLIETQDLRGTFHCHSTWSDGLDSMEAMAQAALALGYEYLGLADHSRSEWQANGLDAARVRQQAVEVKELNARLAEKGFRLFFGAEVDILGEGELDYDEETLDLFDYVIVAVHNRFTLSAAAMTARIGRALAHPKVTMLAHPTGRLLLEREPYAVNMPDVIAAAAQHGKIIEINANPRRLDMDWRLWQHARELGVRCAINPDAHSVADLQFLA